MRACMCKDVRNDESVFWHSTSTKLRMECICAEVTAEESRARIAILEKQVAGSQLAKEQAEIKLLQQYLEDLQQEHQFVCKSKNIVRPGMQSFKLTCMHANGHKYIQRVTERRDECVRGGRGTLG